MLFRSAVLEHEREHPRALRIGVRPDVAAIAQIAVGLAFEDGFGYDRYVDYMLDVPMYFVFRDGKYIDASGQSFRAFQGSF